MDASHSQSIISKLEDYRTSFRSKVIILRQNTKDDNADYFAKQEEVLVKIKAFIKESKDVNAKFRLSARQHQMDTLMQQEKIMDFQLEEITRCVMELEAVFKNFVSGAKDDEITRWNSDFQKC